MLWAIAVVLIILWMMGLGSGFLLGSFIHLLYVAAVVLLVVNFTQEIKIDRKLRRVSRHRGIMQDR